MISASNCQTPYKKLTRIMKGGLCVINRVESVKISFVPVYDLLLMDDERMLDFSSEPSNDLDKLKKKMKASNYFYICLFWCLAKIAKEEFVVYICFFL